MTGKWNWQLEDWPEFAYDEAATREQEASFLRLGGELSGAYRHIEGDLPDSLLTDEALTSSAIEGETLNRDSVRSSVRRQLGLFTPEARATPRERGVAELVVSVFQGWDRPLSKKMLCEWHASLMQGRAELKDVGRFRRHADDMQIVSGDPGHERVHFEAPPSERVPAEMRSYIKWFNGARLSGIARSGIAHLYFECIHPFEDGNGRIGRAIAEKALSQALGGPSLTMLSTEIESRRREYWDQLALANRDLEATQWLEWWADVVLRGQERSLRWVEFTIAKARFLDRAQDEVNERQLKALLRMLDEGPDGFKGGLSSANYQKITDASSATATRDLTDLTDRGYLHRTGEGKGTRYWLPNF